jgi:hypothetical protein
VSTGKISAPDRQTLDSYNRTLVGSKETVHRTRKVLLPVGIAIRTKEGVRALTEPAHSPSEIVPTLEERCRSLANVTQAAIALRGEYDGREILRIAGRFLTSLTKIAPWERGTRFTAYLGFTHTLRALGYDAIGLRLGSREVERSLLLTRGARYRPGSINDFVALALPYISEAKERSAEEVDEYCAAADSPLAAFSLLEDTVLDPRRSARVRRKDRRYDQRTFDADALTTDEW